MCQEITERRNYSNKLRNRDLLKVAPARKNEQTRNYNPFNYNDYITVHLRFPHGITSKHRIYQFSVRDTHIVFVELISVKWWRRTNSVINAKQ